MIGWLYTDRFVITCLFWYCGDGRDRSPGLLNTRLYVEYVHVRVAVGTFHWQGFVQLESTESCVCWLCSAIRHDIQLTSLMKQTPWQANSRSVRQGILRLLSNSKVIAIYTRARHCPYLEPLESSPHPNTVVLLRSILMLSFHVRLGFQNDLFLSEFPTKILQ